ncbi:MAG: metalloregulator ArsR/SmtB family transcription factor [Myxococcota bacterium]|jgi:ArsR family transcriptional regulator|nr:metalloregulator ArsR/SmtB family transcription factor [Myxococcota bacterium]
MQTDSDAPPSPSCGPALELPDTTDERDAALAGLARALGHPTRVAIVRRLGAAEACVTEIVGGLSLAQSTVSQHLKVLKEAGIIRGEVVGPKVCYRLLDESLRTLRGLLEAL